MVFSSILFLFYFLPATLGLYYLAPVRLKNTVLLVASLFFYCWGEVKYFPLIVFSILFEYVIVIIMERHKANRKWQTGLLIFSIIVNLGMLGLFKYADFVIINLNRFLGLSLGTLNLVLPLGISFYTFQKISYTFDYYMGETEVEYSLIDFAAYVVLFPQLIAGPIVRYVEVVRELKHRVLTMEDITEGIRIFILGLGGKVLIANNVGALWIEMEELGYVNLSTPLAWLGLLGFALQIYFDFSGYSLMAIGMGKMMGFKFPENFNYPYISRSFTEFWRRWHMTLGSWIRDYIYFPMGGSRRSPWRTVFNLFVCWFATGLWHGADWNFILWGLLFFLLISIEKRGLMTILSRSAILSRVYFFPVMMISWAIFAITDFSEMGIFLSHMFIPTGGISAVYYLRNYGVSLVIGMVLATPVLEKAFACITRSGAMQVVLYGGILLLSVAYLVDATYNPFLYFRF